MTIRIHWNGHYKNGDCLKRDKFSREYLETLRRDLDGFGREHPDLTRMERCPYCDARLKVQVRGDEAFLNPRCTNPSGLSTATFELNVPSGKLVIANDLRPLFPVLKDHDVNGVQGSLLTTLEYASQSMAHGFVGNSCPGVYQMGDGKANTFKVASLALPEHWDSARQRYVHMKRKSRWRGKRVASICTDLWWYSIADVCECARRAERLGRKLSDFQVEIVDVKPGVYKFVHDCRADKDKPGVDTIYATFQWVRRPDLVKDTFDHFMKLYEPPGRVMLQHLRDWPSLYSRKVEMQTLRGGVRIPKDGPDRTWAEIPEEERAGVLAGIAGHMMVTIGNGVEWHPSPEGSWALTKVDADIPDVPIPEFDFQLNWYPLSYNYCAMIEVPKLAPDWARLGFNILRSMLKYGWVLEGREAEAPEVAVLKFPEDQRPKQLRVLKAQRADLDRDLRRRLSEAAKVYRECRLRYPEIAAETPEFDAWFEHESNTPLGARKARDWTPQVPGTLKRTK